MELIVLTVLLERGIISANVFSALTLMPVITTLLAMPLTRIGLRRAPREPAFPTAQQMVAATARKPYTPKLVD